MRVLENVNLQDAIALAGKHLKHKGSLVKANNWQAREISIGMWEIFDFSFSAEIPHSLPELVKQVGPDLPWADEHFEERVSRVPMNPAPSYVRWPYYKQDDKWRPGGVFSHTYPERIWPRYAGDWGDDINPMYGVRYRYGDLQDVVNLLGRDPLTRQAFLPIWFPEDTGAHHGERVPCTIGYWFIMRDGKLDIYYPIRSCDYRRHFRNDIYMACRLVYWVLNELRLHPTWGEVVPGSLHMQVWNLHVFEGEQNLI